VGDGFGDVSPNPCSTTVEHTEEYQPYELDDRDPLNPTCVVPLGADAKALTPRLRTLEVPAVRVTLPGVRFHLVGLTTSGDEVCLNDRASTRPPFSPGHSTLQVRFTLTGGFLPEVIGISAPTVSLPSTIERSPDGSLWILDEGDLSVATQGRVVRIFPETVANGFTPTAVATGN
jgi:hypothetical protein